jgi:hypothetical protein
MSVKAGQAHVLLPALAGERRIDSTSSHTVTYRYSVEDGSRDLPTCCARSPACCDTSGIALSRRNASNSRSLPEWIVGRKTDDHGSLLARVICVHRLTVRLPLKAHTASP